MKTLMYITKKVYLQLF